MYTQTSRNKAASFYCCDLSYQKAITIQTVISYELKIKTPRNLINKRQNLTKLNEETRF